MTIEIYIALALIVIMLLLIIFNRNQPVPWKNIWVYVKGGIILIGFLIILNAILVLYGKERVVESLYSIWTYVYLLPFIVIVAYIDQSQKNKRTSNDKDDNPLSKQQ